MVHFELVNEDTVTARKGAGDAFTAWAAQVVAERCAAKGFDAPTIKHRKVRAAATKETVWALDPRGTWQDAQGRKYVKVSETKTLKDRASSSGHCSYRREEIQINRGTDFADFQYVVLHELAHWLCGPAAGHEVKFWQMTYRLCEEYGLPMQRVYARARAYKARAATAAMPVAERGQ